MFKVLCFCCCCLCRCWQIQRLVFHLAKPAAVGKSYANGSALASYGIKRGKARPGDHQHLTLRYTCSKAMGCPSFYPSISIYISPSLSLYIYFSVCLWLCLYLCHFICINGTCASCGATTISNLIEYPMGAQRTRQAAGQAGSQLARQAAPSCSTSPLEIAASPFALCSELDQTTK